MSKLTQVSKIISGGQTGADLAGLTAAVALGIETGGTAPKGWRICLENGSNGSNPFLADFGLVEHESHEYRPRTIQNVQDSDGTVWFGYTKSPGGKLTIRTAKKFNKFLIINPTSELLKQWIISNKIKILNVAGNRVSPLNPDAFEKTYQILIDAFLT